ncbi:hypothetical protein HDU84_009895, partial [Entophlyctis sp. JEL0112]
DRDFQGNTPFMRACETTCVEAITLLKPQEEDIEACINSLGLTPFHICTDHRILKTLVDILHPTATMMNFPSYNERLTPLLYHAGKGNTEICESIVCSGLADLHANDLAGRSVLHLSAFRINERLVQTVLDADSSVSGIVSLRGNTCLHAIAAAASIAEVFDEKSVLAIIKAVVSAGCSPSIRNFEGRTAADIAASSEPTLLREILDTYVFLENAKFGTSGSGFYRFAGVVRVLSRKNKELSPPVADTVGYSRLSTDTSPKAVRMMTNRLNNFVKYIIHNPMTSSHSAVEKFFELVDFDVCEIVFN